ncbi:amidohydrolase family protein [Steroidobacter flavus]|uniref:Amidohydrolase family protein n=1 Tax=Steroidobacter flavus TaxID=1842136 RepID=A0ABV8SXU1_9GAMM
MLSRMLWLAVAWNAAGAVAAAAEPTVPLRLTLDEATWMSLDISPDGSTLVFDVLGDLYTLPVAGGEAMRITQGAAFDMQPRFSPDGKRIVFISDRDGGSQVWTIQSDGSNPRAVTSDPHASFSSPEWMPDGTRIVASRHDDRQPNTALDLYLLSLDGAAGTKLVDKQKDALGAAVSPDGRWIYFNLTTGGEGGAGIERLNAATGETQPFVQGYGGAVRPALSPDGRWLAFGRRFDMEPRQRMVLRDLATGAERVLNVALDWDQQGNSLRDMDELPGYAFTPDSSAILYAARGKIRRHDIARDVSTVIPFIAHFEQQLERRLEVKSRIDDGPVQAKLLRWTHESPDRKTLFFSAAGKNYRYDIAKATARPIGDGPGLEYSPAISPDGRWLAYVGWSDREGAHIYKTSTVRGQPIRLTQVAGHYEHLAWSSDGRKLVFLQSSGGEARGEPNLEENLLKSVRWIETASAGPTHLVVEVQSRGDRRQEMRPSFDARGERIYFSETPAKRQPTTLYSIRLDGSDRRALMRFNFADDLMPSPDGKWIAFTEQFEVYLAPLSGPVGDTPVDVKLSGGAVPVVKLSEEGGYFVNWTHDGSAVTWGWGPEYFRRPFDGSLREAAKPSRTAIKLSEPRAGAKGEVLLRGARIISMSDAGVFERGDILIADNRIKAVAAMGEIAAPSAKVIDVSGKTIMPGLIDAHAHYRENRNAEIFVENDWGYVTQLAYGVTTVRDPSARSQSIFTQAEMIEMGRTLGPRVYSSGQPIYFADTAFSRSVQNLEDARMQVRRLKKLGATSIKQYTLPRRDQRQWLVQAAREEGLPIIPEGSQKIAFDLTLLMDGYTTLEHSIKTDTLYRDVRSLITATGTYYVPTLIVGPNGSAEDYFLQHSDVFRDPQLLRFTPYEEIAVNARRREMRPEEDFYFMQLGASAAQIAHEGGRVVLGAHGNRQGLGAHWELWAMAMGGLSPLETLRAGTIAAAQALGLEEDIGSLQAGKIADLIVLDENPLVDIRHSNSLRYVIKNGVIWNARTMDEIWPQQRPFAGYYWTH